MQNKIGLLTIFLWGLEFLKDIGDKSKFNFFYLSPKIVYFLRFVENYFH